MNDKPRKPPGKKRRQPPAVSANQGEGDKRSARRFNEAQESFVQSARGQAAIQSEAAPERGGEGHAELEQAERDGKARSKGEDPAVTRRP